jgi:hypothetical protein
VIETNPRLEDGTPFPTLYWLTCRQLVRLVGTLESSWMAEVNEKLADEATLRKALETATAGYVARRDLIEPLDQSGHPGGGPDRVKCLHAHTAHALVAGDNPIGSLVLQKLEWEDPAEPCV